MGEAQPLVRAGRDHHVGGGQDAGHVVDGSGQADVGLEPGQLRRRAHLVQHGAVGGPQSAARDHERRAAPLAPARHLVARRGQDRHQEGQALLGPGVRDGDEHEVVRAEAEPRAPGLSAGARERRGREGREVDAVPHRSHRRRHLRRPRAPPPPRPRRPRGARPRSRAGPPCPAARPRARCGWSARRGGRSPPGAGPRSSRAGARARRPRRTRPGRRREAPRVPRDRDGSARRGRAHPGGRGRRRASDHPARRGGWATPSRGRAAARLEGHALRPTLLQARHHLGDAQRAAGMDVEGGVADHARRTRTQGRVQGDVDGRAAKQRPGREGAREAVPGRRWPAEAAGRGACRQGRRRSRPASPSSVRRPRPPRPPRGTIAPRAQSGRPVRLGGGKETGPGRREPRAGADEPHGVGGGGQRLAESEGGGAGILRGEARADERSPRARGEMAARALFAEHDRPHGRGHGAVSTRTDSR